jgi:hypothetical protein
LVVKGNFFGLVGPSDEVLRYPNSGLSVLFLGVGGLDTSAALRI